MADPSIHRFRSVMAVALAHLEERRQEINDLNVFPVADGDTGDNMALTMRHVLSELDRLEAERDGDPDRVEIVHAVARAALMGARGNSGVILSQIVRGAAEKLATPPGELIDAELVERALSSASEAARESVRDPAEGTMLTVIREMAEAVTARRARWENRHLEPEATKEEQNALLAEMLATALFAGEEGVRRTPEQLDVLAEAGVVDAGALGLVVIVRGLVAGLAGEQAELPEIPHYAPARTGDVHHADPRYRYCTNFIVAGEGLDRDAVVPELERLGDSVLVVGDEATLKVHVHTDEPEAAMALFGGYGEVRKQDVADMREQIGARADRLDIRTGVLVVTSGDGMRDLFCGIGSHVRALDGRETMNPSTSEILAGIEATPGDQAIVLPNSRNVILAAEEAARLASREVEVVATSSQQEALVSLVEVDPDRDAAEGAELLRRSLEAVRVGGVAPAARDDTQGRFLQGDAVGFISEGVVSWGGAGTTLAETVKRLAEGMEIVTVIEGADAPIPLSELPLQLDEDVEVELHRGGQRGWWWLIAAQ